MSALADWQRALQEQVLHPTAGTLPAQVIGDARASAQRRMSVYTHAYRARLGQILAKDYRGLQALAGSDAFDAICGGYIEATPSHNPNARWFGAQLPAFLRTHADWRTQPALAEMAAFDWAFGLAFDAHDAAVLGFDAVAALAPEDWPSLCFALHPCLQRLSFRHNIAAIRRALDHGEDLPPLQVFASPQPWAVWRHHLAIRHRRLDDAEAAVLAALADGACFAELCEKLTAWHAADQVALQAATLLRTWLADGWISTMTLAATASTAPA